MQHHPQSNRRYFMDMPEDTVKDEFKKWVTSTSCPWHVHEQYLADNGVKSRGGAGPAAPKQNNTTARLGVSDAEQRDGLDGEPYDEEDWWNGWGNWESEEEHADQEDHEEHHCTGERDYTGILRRLLYAGGTVTADRSAEQQRKSAVHNVRHDYYRPSRCTMLAQEESSATPMGVTNVNEDSDDPDAYDGEQKETAKEMDELRAVRHWINQEVGTRPWMAKRYRPQHRRKLI